MRALLLITYLFTSLLVGGNKMHANTHTISSVPILNLNSTYKIHNKFLHSKRGHSYPIVVNKDLDLNEEYSSNEDLTNSVGSKLVKFKQTVLTKWYSTDDNLFIITFPYNRFYITKPLNGQSTPIYISHSVLRI